MRTRRAVVFLMMVLFIVTSSQAQEKLQLKTATGHPMQYYVSLPAGWNASKKWPVVLVFEAAEKEYKVNAERFVTAREKMPFIIVAPIHTNNGNQGRRDPGVFPYDTKTWDDMDKVGDCVFNDEGITHVLRDVQQLYQGESKVYVTGFEAGAHMVWWMVFNHPEYLNAAAPVAGNYRSRCVDEQNISKHSSKSTLPIMAFSGAKDNVFGPGASLFAQWTNARDLAKKNGFNNLNETIVPDNDHVPMPGEVLTYFLGLL